MFEKQLLSTRKTVEKYGQPIQLCKKTVTQDQDTPWEATYENSYTDAYAVFLPVDKTFEAFQYYIGDTELHAGMVRIIFPNYGVVPELTDTVIRDERIYKIKKIEELSPNGTPILWYLDLQE